MPSPWKIVSLLLRYLLCCGLTSNSDQALDETQNGSMIYSASYLGLVLLEQWENKDGEDNEKNEENYLEENAKPKSPKPARMVFPKFQPNMDAIPESQLELLKLLN